jgi:hypothetical protein
MPVARGGEAPINPALRYRLLVGDWAPGRVHGWVTAMSDPTPEALSDAWTQHADSLQAEAAAAGFAAWGASATKRRPRGPAVERWRAAFLREHTY